MTDPIAALLCSLHDQSGQGHARPAQRGEQGSQMTIASTNRPRVERAIPMATNLPSSRVADLANEQVCRQAWVETRIRVWAA